MGKNQLELIVPEESFEITTPAITSLPTSTPIAATGNKRSDITISAEPITIIVTKALDIVNGIARCIADVNIEKEHTRQIKAQAQAAIKVAKETTKQIYIQETETTKRIISEYAAEVNKAEIELIKLDRELHAQIKEKMLNHHEAMKKLNTAEKVIVMLSEQSKKMFDLSSANCSECKGQEYLNQLNIINDQLVQLIQQLFQVKGEIK